MEPVQLRALGVGEQAPADLDLQSALLATAGEEREQDGRPVELPSVLEALPEGVLVVGAADRRVWAANEAARSILGRTDLVGLPIAEVLGWTRVPAGEPWTEERWPIGKALQDEAVPEVELTVRQPTGAELPVLAAASPVRAPHGQVVGALVTLRNIARLREGERLWEDFVGLIVHESRGALTAILGCVGLLESLAQEPIRPRKTPGYVDPETQFLGMIKADVWQLNTMMSELLDVARIGARDVKLDKQPVDVAALVDDLVDHLAPNTGTLVTGHQVKVIRRRLMPVVEADPARLEQILTSLVMTTARYSPPGTEILVRVESGPEEVTISVSSKTGGIPRDELNRLFDHYLRREDLRQEYKGLGLSLHVARGLVEAHGGRIWAESRIGRGTTFRFALPMQ